MKFLFDYYDDTWAVSNVFFGIGGYKHYYKLPYKGYTLELYIFKRIFTITFINNYKAYLKKQKDDDRKMNEYKKRLKSYKWICHILNY